MSAGENPKNDKLDDECVSCSELMPRNECQASKRPCGHHCNHSWPQDACCWCGKEFGEVDDDHGSHAPECGENPKVPPMTAEGGGIQIPAERAEALARDFHEWYELLAPKFGYETRPETRKFDPTTPNGRLMTAVCSGFVLRLMALEEENARLRSAIEAECAKFKFPDEDRPELWGALRAKEASAPINEEEKK